MRKIIPFNNQWSFRPLNTPSDHKPIFVDLPHTVEEVPYHYFDEAIYQFQSLYCKSFSVEALGLDEALWIRFEGVMLYARVTLNGHVICEHKGGYTPFEANLTPYLNTGSENTLEVLVDATERKDIPPFGNVVDFLTYGGIYREVTLERRHKTHIQNAKFETSLSKASWKSTAFMHGEPYEGYMISHSLYLQGKRVAESGRIPLTKDTLTYEARIEDIQPWTLDSPVLYESRISLYEKNNCVDTFTRSVGFRDVSFQKDGFYLNGSKLKIRGLNRHQAFPYVGYAMPKRAQEKDADILKYELGVNMVRCSHYPQSTHFLNRCDAIGLLVFNEIPGWQHIGDAQWQDLATQSVREMIERDWNHASVVIWGVRINESPDSTAFYQKNNALAHELDTTRPTGGVRNFAGSEVFEDVYTYNDFVHRGDNIALEPPKAIHKSAMPYLVTEHNGHMFPTKKFDQEAKRLEHALRHLRVLNTAYLQEDSAGAIGWCMFDYNTHKDFGSGDKICYHGVMDMFRLPKLAAAVYASQQDESPVLEVSSSMNIGEYNASSVGDVYVFTNCDAIKVYKNDRFIETHYPNQKAFPGLPHPPVIIEDFIGKWIEEDEAFSPKDAQTIKDLLLKVLKNGNHLPLMDKLKMARLFLKYKMTTNDAARLYGQYIANWGSESTLYRFEGYRKGALVKTVIKTANAPSQFHVIPDDTQLVHGDTYDVTRIVLSFTDAHGQPLAFSNHVVSVAIQGSGAIIGPHTFALIGGSRAFWVKTTGKGSIDLSLTLEGAPATSLTLHVH